MGVVLVAMSLLALTSEEATRSSSSETSRGRSEMARLYVDFSAHVVGGSIDPHWLEDGNSFWYADQEAGQEVVRRVDPVRNVVEPYSPPKGQMPAHPDSDGVPSPDGRWVIDTEDHQLVLRSVGGSGEPLTDDGSKFYEWNVRGWPAPAVLWSPEGERFVACRYDERESPRIPIVHSDGPRDRVTWHPWVGDPGRRVDAAVFDVPGRTRRRLEVPAERGDDIHLLSWHPDGRRVYMLKVDRFFTRVELLEVDTDRGHTRRVLSERAERGYLYDHPERESLFTLLPDRGQFVWKSLRDGWSQLYLYDLSGKMRRRLTLGAFPVERVVTADERRGWIYFVARADRERIYDTHLYRTGLDGEGFHRLTEEPGQHDARFHSRFLHQIRFSPSRRFFLDTHSSPRRPPRVDLRRADGTLVRTLTEANVEGLEALRWSPPEQFVVRAADGVTRLHGILYKPYDFDPRRRYPVIAVVYGSAASVTNVPRTFVPSRYAASALKLAQWGFITFMLDARGGGGRSKAFRDVVYGRVGEIEIADHVAALGQLASTRPYLDLERVGIRGGSYGGYMAIRGMLAAPEVFSVGVATAPITDLNDHYNEIYTGPRSTGRNEQALNTNTPLAGALEGKLLIIHGTADTAVPIGQTMRLVGAFIEAGRPVDLLVMPDETHGSPGIWSGYGWDTTVCYFREHLLGEVCSAR
jgi:dipeptidyl aminopeptidase/acylaminoacyl peptidase